MHAGRDTRRPGPRSPRKPVLTPQAHEVLVVELGRRLDDVEQDLADTDLGCRAAARLRRRRLALLGRLAGAEHEHALACEPRAWRPADGGRGVVVMTRGGFEVALPDRTAEEMRALGLEPLPF